MMRWFLNDLDDDLSRIRGLVLGRVPGAVVAPPCDDEEVRLFPARGASFAAFAARSPCTTRSTFTAPS